MGCVKGTSPDVKIRTLAPSDPLPRPGAGEELPDDAAEVWLADPRHWNSPERSRMLAAVLSDPENERLNSFRFAEDRLAFLVSHALVRFALSRFAPVEPEQWVFHANEHGRPSIFDPPSPLRFNLSHTKGLVACAVVRGGDVGIDVEDVARSFPDGIAERFFAPDEVAALSAVCASERNRRFFEYWTLKEAYIKARGIGLSMALDKFSFRRHGSEWRISSAQAHLHDPARWWFHTWAVGSHQAAIALEIGRQAAIGH